MNEKKLPMQAPSEELDMQPSRRTALARLGLLGLGAFVAPSLLTISEAEASGGKSKKSKKKKSKKSKKTRKSRKSRC